MTPDNLKYVVGAVEKDKPAVIRFYGAVNEHSTEKFNEEFLWLQDFIKPSKIQVLINSEGGSVLAGMSTFSLICSCPIETETIVEGIAASMGSVIWSAGKNIYMRDYSLLMIHNPFINGDSNEQVISAFKTQIETIYTKRLGLPLSKVRKIMDGEGDNDGTFITADEAVELGIISKANVIKTPKAIREKVAAQVRLVNSVSEMQEVFCSMEKFNLTNTSSMDKYEVLVNSIVSQLGIETTDASMISDRIVELKNASKQVTELTDALNEMKIQKEGVEAQLKNTQSQLESTNNELQQFKKAEEEKREAEINEVIDNAISLKKISAESKENWIEMAHTNFDMVKNTLNSIPSADKISNEITEEPKNKKEVKDAVEEAEALMQKAVEEVIGSNFQFKTLG